VTFTELDGTEQILSNDILAAAVGPMFRIPTLWGTPDTPPYFHDNSAKDLEAVLVQYNFMFRTIRDFGILAGCSPDAVDCLGEQDRADIIAYMQLLSFEGSGVGMTAERR
jgi:hypothetical protein